ncbi:MAG: hypothetical protein QGG50_08445 [Methanopyri archaeon]|jgi:hypothetical protein|nr:hypothetical protein [Methanopyri archaeon]
MPEENVAYNVFRLIVLIPVLGIMASAFLGARQCTNAIKDEVDTLNVNATSVQAAADNNCDTTGGFFSLIPRFTSILTPKYIIGAMVIGMAVGVLGSAGSSKDSE